MNAFTVFLQADWAERAGWALLHSLWQIAAVAAVYGIAAFLLRGRSANSRYVVGCAAMFAMLGLPVGTYALLSQDAPAEIEEASNTPVAAALPTESPEPPGEPAQPGIDSDKAVAFPVEVTAGQPARTDFLSELRRYMPWATAVWLTGVLLLSLRPLWGWFHVRRLRRRGLSPLSDTLLQAGRRVKGRLCVNRAVEFVQSALVEVPTVIGSLRPMILLPASAITGLSVAEIELILAHELAHVKRHDWLLNFVQTVIEALLFYHPGMWWVSSQIRKERENCCDDMAVGFSGNRTVYVQALARLEEQRSAKPAVVLAATGGSLLTRVRRLLGQPADDCGYRYATAWVAGLVTIGFVVMALVMNPAAGARDAEEDVMKRILADWERKRAAVQTFRYEFDGTTTVLKGALNLGFDALGSERPRKPGESIPEKTHVGPVKLGLLLDFRNQRVREEEQGDLFDADDRKWRPSEVIRAYDGTHSNRYSPTPGFSGEEWPSTVVFYEDCDNCLADPLHRPLLFAHGRIPHWGNQNRPRDYFRWCSDEDDFTVVGQREYKGRKCTVLSVSAHSDPDFLLEELWVDVDRESAIVRWRFKVYGILVEDTQIDYHQTEHGWLPKSFTYNTYIGQTGDERTSLPRELHRFRVTKASINPKLQLADFQLKPSPGMMVRNEATRKKYRVPAEGNAADNPKELDDASNVDPPVNPASEQEASSNVTRIEGLVVDADKQPIADALVLCNFRISGVDTFKPIHLRTDAKGQFRANVPNRRFVLYVRAPSTDYEDVDSFGVQDGRVWLGRSCVEDRSSDGVVKPVVTLQKSYDVRFDLVDAKTQRPVSDAAILYKEDERYYMGDENDYEAIAIFVAYRMLKEGRPVFQKVRAKLDSARILVLATGYEPARLKFDETLKRGKTTKRIAMNPLPPLELTIVAPDGKPAAGATFTTLDPKEFRRTFDYAGDKGPLLNIEETSDEQGIVRVAYPAFGDWAAYRIMHSAGYADLRIKDLPAATDQDAPIRHRIELAPYATIRGKYLPEVSENGYLEICRLKPSRMHVDGPFERVELDDQRRFQIATRLAGWHSIRHIEPTGRGFSLLTSYDSLKIAAGQTVDLTLGDEGRPVTGRLVSLEGPDFKKQLFKLSVSLDGDFRYPQAPLDITDDNALEAWWDAYWESDEGQKYREYRRRNGLETVPDESGRFHFPMVRPGKYKLRLVHRVQNEPSRSPLKLEFEVPEGYSAEPLDLGELRFSEETAASSPKIEGPVSDADYLGPVAVVKPQPRPTKSLHWAAQNGDVDLANRLISSGADVEAEDSNGHTPLALAAYAGHKELVELLHAKGAKIDSKDMWDYTPLFHAASNGHADVVEFLIAEGANVNVKINLGYTPLILAVTAGHTRTVKLLLAAGADVNTVANVTSTPLGEAVFAGHTETVRLLIAAGADINTGGSSRETPLMKAASAGHIEIARLLIAAGAKVDGSALYEAIMAGDRQMAGLMLEKGAVVTFPALHFAAFMGDLPKVQELIEQDTDVDSRDDDEQTPLFLAVLGGQRQVIEFLLGKGADIEARDKFPSTVLQKTAQRGDKDMVEFLLAKGADVNAASGENARTITPLGCAVRYGHRDAAAVLLEHGAAPDAKGLCGRVPLQWAASSGRTEIVKLLLEHGATVDARVGDDEMPPLHWTAGMPPLHGAVDDDKVEMIKLLIAHGADVNSRDRYRATALHRADPNGAAILIAHGADVNARDEKGRMPIHPAATNGDPRLVQMLIAEGADINAKDGNGRTPLHYGAVSTRFKVSKYNTDPTATMEVLLAAGAEIDAKAANGATPLYEAATNGSTEAVTLLLAKGADFNVKADEDDDKGLTLLHTAAKHFKLDIVALLIDKGADVNARTENGRTPMDLAKARAGLDADGMAYQRRTIRVLVEHGAEE